MNTADLKDLFWILSLLKAPLLSGRHLICYRRRLSCYPPDINVTLLQASKSMPEGIASGWSTFLLFLPLSPWHVCYVSSLWCFNLLPSSCQVYVWPLTLPSWDNNQLNWLGSLLNVELHVRNIFLISCFCKLEEFTKEFTICQTKYQCVWPRFSNCLRTVDVTFMFWETDIDACWNRFLESLARSHILSNSDLTDFCCTPPDWKPTWMT